MGVWGDSRAAMAISVLAMVTCSTVASRARAQCAPDCRSGYVCEEGQCVSACNPPCASGERCTAEAECVAAGVSADATAPASFGAPAAAVDDGTISVRFAPRAPDIELSVRQPDGSFRPLCVGACESRLTPAVYTFAVARFGRAPIAATPVPLRYDAVLTASYRNRRGMRIVGWVLATVGIGLAVTGFSLWGVWGTEDAAAFAPIVASGGLFLGAGLGMTFAKDRVTVGVVQP